MQKILQWDLKMENMQVHKKYLLMKKMVLKFLHDGFLHYPYRKQHSLNFNFLLIIIQSN